MARVFVEVFGCSANVADAEIVMGLLREAGHTIADSPRDSEASIILTCIVKTPTEIKVVRRLRELSELGKPMIVAGCMPKAEAWLAREAAPRASLMGPDDILGVVKNFENTVKGERVEAISESPQNKTCLPRVRKNPVIHIAPVASGCLGSCSYCIVRHARGHLKSFPAHEIVSEAKEAIDQGCREIWVTAEDTASYNCDGLGLPELLNSLSSIEGRFLIRVGMMTPSQAQPILRELIEAYLSEKVFKFLHVPVQSGNDQVLERMRRRYTVDDLRDIVFRFREAIPDLCLSTDIICGFPGETEEQFRDSLNLVEEVKPDVLNISRFWPRPGTDAEKLDGRLHGRETKRRSRELSEMWSRMSVENGNRWIGWTGEVLIDEKGNGRGIIGRNSSYKAVVVQDPAPLGDFIAVRVTGSGRGYLKAERV